MNELANDPKYKAAYEKHLAEKQAEWGDNVIYEDSGVIDTDSIDIDRQPCGALDPLLNHCCDKPAIYRVFGQWKEKHGGARFKKFDTHLCDEHMAAWCKKHGIDLAERLAESGE